MRLAVTILALILTLGSAVAAETPLGIDEAFRLSVGHAPSGAVQLHWEMPPGFYLYRQYLSAETQDGKPVALMTVPGVKKTDNNFGESEVYYTRADAEFDPPDFAVTVTYQGCQEHGLCYPPARRIIDPTTLSVSEVPLFSSAVPEQSDWSKAAAAGGSTGVGGPATGDQLLTGLVDDNDIVGRFLLRGGVPLLLVAFVGFGMLLALTPCVFPLYPILAATLERQGERLSARRGFVLSSSYAISLALAFAIFGAVAAWTGQNLQIALQSRVTVLVVAVTFAALAFSMFGLFELQLPAGWVARLGRSRPSERGSIGAAAILGFSSAFIIGPCVTAPVAGALLYVARTGNIALGAALLFALGLGKGVPLVIFGTVGSHALPRAGDWMGSIKTVFGFIFFAFAISMAEAVLFTSVSLALWAVWAMAAAVFLGAFEITRGPATPARIGIRSLGLLAAIYAVLLVIGVAVGSVDPLRPLEGILISQSPAVAKTNSGMLPLTSKADLAHRLDDSHARNKATLVYFTADWCVSCRSIDRDVLSSPEVASALEPVNTLEVDLTNLGPEQRELMRALDVVGPPTMIFFRPDRMPVTGGRLLGEIKARDVVKAALASRGDRGA